MGEWNTVASAGQTNNEERIMSKLSRFEIVASPPPLISVGRGPTALIRALKPGQAIKTEGRYRGFLSSISQLKERGCLKGLKFVQRTVDGHTWLYCLEDKDLSPSLS